MVMRHRALPPGWYPNNRAGIEAAIASWEISLPPSATAASSAKAAVRPMPAGFFGPFRGSGDFRPCRGRDYRRHRRAFALVRLCFVAAEDGFDTPLGPLLSDTELRDALSSSFKERQGGPLREDTAADNTVEVQLPLISSAFRMRGSYGCARPTERPRSASGKPCTPPRLRSDVKWSASLHRPDPLRSRLRFLPQGQGRRAESGSATSTTSASSMPYSPWTRPRPCAAASARAPPALRGPPRRAFLRPRLRSHARRASRLRYEPRAAQRRVLRRLCRACPLLVEFEPGIQYWRYTRRIRMEA